MRINNCLLILLFHPTHLRRSLKRKVIGDPIKLRHKEGLVLPYQSKRCYITFDTNVKLWSEEGEGPKSLILLCSCWKSFILWESECSGRCTMQKSQRSISISQSGSYWVSLIVFRIRFNWGRADTMWYTSLLDCTILISWAN